MGRYFRLFVYILIGLILYGVYYWGIPAAINLPQKSDVIEQLIFEQTGMKAEIENPHLRMGYFPAIEVSAKNLSILNEDSSKALDIFNPKINISLLPLFIKKLNINNLVVDKLDADINYDGKFKLGQYNLDDLPPLPLTLNRATISLKDYKIKLNDEKQNKQILLSGKYFTVNEFINNKNINFSTDADLNTGTKNSSIKADINLKLPLDNISNDHIKVSGHITNLDLSDFSEYIRVISKDEIKSASGIINVVADTSIDQNYNKITTHVILKDLGIYKNELRTSIISNGKLEVEGEFSTIHNGIDIRDLKIKGDDINIFVLGQITKLNSKLPNLNIKTGVLKSRAEKILALLPASPDLVPDIDLLTLKRAGFWGGCVCIFGN